MRNCVNLPETDLGKFQSAKRTKKDLLRYQQTHGALAPSFEMSGSSDSLFPELSSVHK